MVTSLEVDRHPFRKLLDFGLGRKEELAPLAVISAQGFVAILVPLLAITYSVSLLQIEQGLQLPALLWVVLAGFAINAWLPLTWRLPSFLGLNIVALILLFGSLATVLTVGLGLLLVGLASLAIPLRYRLFLILAIVMYLVLVKAGYVANGLMYQVSGLLGGLFMFRLILYVYELQHEKEQASVWQRIAYFFLLPNLIFQLFPIVDYKTFVRGYYAKPAFETYRKGLEWVGLGVTHLLLYRVIYHYGVLPAESVDSLPGLVQYLVTGYALIIRLSGLFHLSAGIICLFGFDLPRTFDNYFLASSFSDLWHRINSYWRAFVMKVFYFPVYFRFKHLGAPGVFISVLLVFVVNFFLHAYQWFWIRGTVMITQADILFWGILGLLLACNSVVLMQRNTRRGKQRYSFKGAMQKALKVLGMFTFMCLMWSLWTSGTVEQWLVPFREVGAPDAVQLLCLLAVGLALVSLGVFYQFLVSRDGVMANILMFSPLARPAYSGLIFVAVCILASESGLPQVERLLGKDLSAITSETLNAQDEELMFRGYYDELIVANTLGSRMWELEEQQKRGGNPLPGIKSRAAREQVKKHPLADSWVHARQLGMLDEIDHPPWQRYKPNQTFVFHGATFTTNAHGLRDKNYSLQKPGGTYRIAQLGSSPELGMGVGDQETSEYYLEELLNASRQWGSFNEVEIINFAMGGYTLYEHMSIAEHAIDKFEPDAVMLFIHDVNSLRRFNQQMVKGVLKGLAGEFPELVELAEEVGLRRDTPERKAERLLEPYAFELFTNAFERVVQHCREKNIELLIVYVGVINNSEEKSQANMAQVYPLLRDSGHVFMDLADVFRSRPREELIVAPWDYHPNPEGQKMVADRLYALMMANRDKILKE